MLIFLDESGDLGFDFDGKSPSTYFVITLLVCHNKVALDSFKQAVRRTLKNKLNHKKGGRKVEELHANATTLPIKQYFYNQVKSRDWTLFTVALFKPNVYQHLRTRVGKKKLYNFLAKFLIQKIDLSTVNPALTLVVDKCKNKDEIADFNAYLENQLEASLPLNIPLNIYHEDSRANPGLQAVDCFCWGIYRKYQHRDTQWYQTFAGQIAFETEYLA